MKHHIFTVLSALSLLLFVAVLALWVDTGYLLGPREYRSTKLRTGPSSAETHYGVGVDSRALAVSRVKFSPTPTVDASPAGIAYRSGWGWNGFEWASHPLIGVGTGRVLKVGWQSQLRIPYWALLIMFAIMPTWFWLSHRNRRRREKRGHCPICDYDLRASKERCPECGTPISPPESAKQTERTA